MLKIAEFAPMPTASETMATSVTPLLFQNCLRPYRISWIKMSMVFTRIVEQPTDPLSWPAVPADNKPATQSDLKQQRRRQRSWCQSASHQTTTRASGAPGQKLPRDRSLLQATRETFPALARASKHQRHSRRAPC